MIATNAPSTSSKIRPDLGSFRDPSGGVFERDGRIFRYFRTGYGENFKRLQAEEFFKSALAQGVVIDSLVLDPEEILPYGSLFDDTEMVVEHPRIPFVSYCYEWPFEMLKSAAELQLEITEQALRNGYTLKDATPFNIQYSGNRPVFIDVGSFEPMEEGSSWRAYSQFCQAFYSPLLLQAHSRIPFQPWLRGSLEGIPLDQLRSLLPVQAKLRPSIFVDVVLQTWLNKRFAGNEKVARSVARQKVRPASLLSLVSRLRRQVARLKVHREKSVWSSYEETKDHYGGEARSFKERFIRTYVERIRPGLVWDLGSNRGEYSLIAAEHSGYVVAMDSDEACIGALYERLKNRTSNVLPLVVDLMNPSPSQGWAGHERKTLMERGQPDLTLSLALVHHLAIAGNVPFIKIADWLASMGPRAIVEFPPKEDPMVQRLLSTRQDVYGDYSQEAFEAALTARFNIEEKAPLPSSRRLLYALVRK